MTMQFDRDLASKYKTLFLQVRALLLEDSSVLEIKKPRITTYQYAGTGLCHVRTRPNGVDIGFLKGVQLIDELALLKGSGKKVRVLQATHYSKQQLTYYINQAKKING